MPDESIIKDLKIQIINPFIRILASTFGLFLIISGLLAVIDQSIALGISLAIIGIILCVFGFKGKKKKLEKIVEKSDHVNDIALVIEAILQIDWGS